MVVLGIVEVVIGIVSLLIATFPYWRCLLSCIAATNEEDEDRHISCDLQPRDDRSESQVRKHWVLAGITMLVILADMCVSTYEFFHSSVDARNQWKDLRAALSGASDIAKYEVSVKREV